VDQVMAFHVRPVTADDAAGIEAVRSAGWRTAYRGLVADEYLDGYAGDVERRRGLIESAGPELVQLVAVDDTGTVLGWSGGGPCRDDDFDPGDSVQEVYSCYVDPHRWAGGIGATVLTAVMAELELRGPAITLWVLSGNPRARRFYESHGFVADGAEKPAAFPGEPMEMRYVRPSPNR
jgi:ribosomal protein S18 acetylase RimI-like enzyme